MGGSAVCILTNAASDVCSSLISAVLKGKGSWCRRCLASYDLDEELQEIEWLMKSLCQLQR